MSISSNNNNSSLVAEAYSYTFSIIDIWRKVTYQHLLSGKYSILSTSEKQRSLYMRYEVKTRSLFLCEGYENSLNRDIIKTYGLTNSYSTYYAFIDISNFLKENGGLYGLNNPLAIVDAGMFVLDFMNHIP